ncbi:kinase-like domain-containing protein [Baffinella frigidus]|nr:kinase-like domain-containing protein [Cryptophyta sp. CCMP2293]
MCCIRATCVLITFRGTKQVVDKDGINNIKDLERVMREMHVLKNIRHPNIISLHDVIERGSKIYLVLDFAQGGELNEYIIAKGAVPEREARTWFAQIMSGVDFCHRQHVSHRDLKPENVLMQGSTVVCKIADFGLSNDMVAGEMLKTVCGTPAFAAPEVTLGQKYDGAAVDVWSLGAILFTMVAGTIPFDSGSQPELFRKIQHGVYSVPVHCSPELADMIRRFLEVQPLKRATIAQAWQVITP